MFLSLTLALCPAVSAPTLPAAEPLSAVCRPGVPSEAAGLAFDPGAEVRSLLAAPTPAAGSPSPLPVAPRGGDAVSQPVRFLTDDKQELAATYYGPRKKGDPVTGVLLVHDAGADREPLADLAEALQKKGYAVLTFDLRGHGESASDRTSWKADDAESNKKLWAFAKRDVDAAARFLKGQDGVHSSSLVLVAQGASCALALDHAVSDDTVRAAVLISPQKDDLGYDLEGDLAQLAGLPIHMYSCPDGKKDVQALADHAHEANDGYEYVTVTPLRCEPAEVLTDKRFRVGSLTWIGKALEGDA